MKKLIYLTTAAFLALFLLGSCSESEGDFDPMEGWEARNKTYVDSIANLATSPGSEWQRILSYKMKGAKQETLGSHDFIYYKVIKGSTEESAKSPLFIDKASVNYRGMLIPLLDGMEITFDESYKGELDRETAVPSEFAPSQVVEGFATALLSMKPGDRWMVVIPPELGYGGMNKPTIPSWSVLKFDIDLVKINELKDK